MTKKEIKEEIIYYKDALVRALDRNDYQVIKDAASHINDLSYLILSREESREETVEAINNSASLHQAECPVCGKPFTRPDGSGYHVCSKCSSRIHYRAFTPSEIVESLTDDGNPDCE